MKQLLLFLLFPVTLIAQNWEPLGPSDYNKITYSSAEFLGTTTSPSGQIYAVYQDERNQDRLTVRTWNGQKWVDVGPAGFTPSRGHNCAIACNAQNVPYVVFGNGNESNRISVMRYTNGNWSYVGQPRVSVGSGGLTTIAFDNQNRPVVGFLDWGEDGKLVVKRLQGNSWVDVAGGVISNHELKEQPYLTINQQTNDYIIQFQELITPYPRTVAHKNGVWIDISDTTQGRYHASIELSATGQLYSVSKFGTAESSDFYLRTFQNNTWQTIPTNNFTDTIRILSNMVFDQQNNLWIVNHDLDKLILYKYDGTVWTKEAQVACNFFLYNLSLRLENNLPVLLFQDAFNGAQAFCLSFFPQVNYYGGKGFTSNTVIDIQTELDSSHQIYASMFTNYTTVNPSPNSYWKLELKRFDGVNWLPVGDPAYWLGNNISDFAFKKNGKPWVISESSGVRVTRLDAAGNWKDVASNTIFPNFLIDEVQIEISDSNTPYISYFSVIYDSIYVKKYENGAWLNLDGGQISNSGTSFIRMVLDGEEPIISYYTNDGLKIFKHNSGSWTQLPDPGVYFPYSNYKYDLAIFDGNVYIAVPGIVANALNVLFYNGINWTTIGGSSLVPNGGVDPKLDFDDNGNVYLSYLETSGKLRIMKYNGNLWQAYPAEISPCISEHYDMATLGLNSAVMVFDCGGAYAKGIGPTISIPKEDAEQLAIGKIWPNPTTGEVFLELNDGVDLRFEVYSTTGQRMLSGETENGLANFSLRQWPSGFYIIRFENGFAQKLIKQ